MDSKERKSKKRPTIAYYSIPAIRRSNDECEVTTDQEELWDKNSDKNCINKNTVQRQSNIESNPHPMKEAIPSTTSQIPLDLNRSQTPSKDTEQNDNNVVKYNSDEERSRGHRQISVDLSTLKNVVYRHFSIEVLSHRVKRQIRMNRFLSWHRPSELKFLEKAYRNKECTKEDYLKILKIILKDVFIGRDTNISAEFCSCLLEKDDHKEKGERMCLQTFLIGLEDLIVDYSNPCINDEMWKKFILFLAELFFITEINLYSLCLLPLISNALTVARYYV